MKCVIMIYEILTMWISLFPWQQRVRFVGYAVGMFFCKTDESEIIFGYDISIDVTVQKDVKPEYV